MNKKYLKAVIVVVLLTQVLVVGCGKQPEATSASTNSVAPAPESGTGGPKLEKGGAAADTKAYPAPSGTQTGNFAGGQK